MKKGIKKKNGDKEDGKEKELRENCNLSRFQIKERRAFSIGGIIFFPSLSSSPRYKTLGSIKVIGAEFKILNDTSKHNYK